MTRTTTVDEIQIRKQMLLFFETHSTRETEECFGVTSQTIRKWQRRYDGTDESLLDKRNEKKQIIETSVSEEEKVTVLTSLLKYNAPGRKRNVLEPTYYAVYEMDGRFRGKRSRAALRKLANKLIGACPRRGAASAEKSERKHYHQPKMPGEVQIDKKYVPVSCFSGSLPDPENIEKLRAQIKGRAIVECNSTLRRLYEDLESYPSLEKTIRYCCRETINQYIMFCRDVAQSDISDLLKKRFYQYTAIDEFSRWTFRMMFDIQCEQAAFRFLDELIKAAPFKISRVKTDNGSEFTSKYLKNHDAHETLFETRLLMEGIKYYRIQPGKPWQNGKVESQHRLDQERFYDCLRMNDLEDGQCQLAIYNKESRQFSKSCLKGRSPMDVLTTMGIAA